MTPLAARITGLVLALVLGQFFFLRFTGSWTNCWLIADGEKGTALVTEDLTTIPNAVAYKYVVNQKEYFGESRRDWKTPNKAKVGEETTVYYSASHPWISRLYLPDTIVQGLPVILFIGLFEFFAIMTIINPRSRFAFSLLEKEKKNDG
jgi:hypothetical protein